MQKYNIRRAALGTCFALLLALPACVHSGENFDWGGSNKTATNTITDPEITIRAVIMAQAASWNRGDIAGFMEGYWQSEDLRFASGGNVTRGWQATHDRYVARYGDSPETMGELSFTELEVTVLSDEYALVHGRWRLDYADTAPNGLFTLLFRNVDGSWVIVSDTTTSAD